MMRVVGAHGLGGGAGEDGFAPLLYIAEVHEHRRYALAALLDVLQVVEVVEVRLVLLGSLCAGQRGLAFDC